MGAEFTIKVSGTSGTRFSLKYRAKRGFLDLLLGRGTSTWRKVEGTVPAEYKVSGTGVELRDARKRSAGEVTVEVLGAPGGEMRFTL